MVQLKVSIVVLIVTISIAECQTSIEPTSEKWTVHSGEVVFDGEGIHLLNDDKGSAILWLKDANLKNGVIELDIKGKDAPGQSFLGVAFHGKDNKSYDAVYFRPFNFKSVEKKNNAIQYIEAPKKQWDYLRKKFPGQYESEIQPIPDPNGWFHATIVIDYPSIEVFVNGSFEPTLVLQQISQRTEGKVGLWIDSDDGWFKNVSITNR